MALRKYFLLLFLAFFSIFNLSSENFIDTLKAANFFTMARSPNGNGYISTIVIKNGVCLLNYESEGAIPSILGMVIRKESLKLLIKQRWTGDEEFTPGVGYISRYYIVEITKADLLGNTKEINAIKQIDRPSEQFLDSSQLLQVLTILTNDKQINVRLEKGVSSKKISQVDDGIQFQILGIDNEYITINGRSDYWFHVKNTKIDGRIFGYYLDGPNGVALK